MPSVRVARDVLAAEAIQPSYSCAARGIQCLPPQLPIRTGGPPSAPGHGVSWAAPTFSPRQRRRISGRAAWSACMRPAKSRPSASKSVGVDPAPTPRSSRPLQTRCAVRMRWASSTGLRSGTCSTHVPISTRVVTAAATETPISGSGRMKPRPIASKNHTLSNPSRSARRTLSSSAAPVKGAPSGWALARLTPSLTRSPRHAVAARVARPAVFVVDDPLRRRVGTEQAQLLVAHHPEGVRGVGRQRDRIALPQHDRAVFLAVDPGLRGAVEDVQDLQIRVRVHRGLVAGLRGLDAGADRGGPRLVADDRLVVRERTEADLLGLLESDHPEIAHRAPPLDRKRWEYALTIGAPAAGVK